MRPHRRRDRAALSDDERVRVLLLLALTVGTGAVDAVSYFSLDHVFTANMSGNMALLGIGIATSIRDVEGNVYAFGGFVIGAALGGWLLRARPVSAMAGLRRGLVIEFAVLVPLAVAVGAVDLDRHDVARFAVCFVLAAAMGLQTGLARSLAVKDVNTTVATMTLHGLAADGPWARGDAVRWRRRLGVVLALLVGAAAGVAADRVVAWGGLAVSSVIVGIAAVAAQYLALAGDGAPRPVALASGG